MAKATSTNPLKELNSIGSLKGDFEFSAKYDYLQVAIDKFVKQLQSNLIKDKRVASGNLYQSVGGDGDGSWEVDRTDDGVSIKLWLPEYYEYTDTGRKPTERGGNGKVERNLRGLRGWISQKKLVHSDGMKFLQKWKLKDGTIKKKWVKKTPAESNKILAFLIARKIHNKGYKGSKWFTRAVPSFEKQIANALGLTLGSVKINIEVNGKKWQ